ncbi:MAG: protein-glutamate O-methyltransferase CheR [Spongiibacteraceae bacterium]
MEAWLQPALPPLNDQQFADWQQLVESTTGIDLSQHRPILQGGLSRRMRKLGYTDYDAYFDQVTRWPEGLNEWRLLLDSIAVKETSFFRQPAAFELMRNYLRKRVHRTKTIDIWSVGCSTGEEAYGLAMVATDVIERESATCFLGVLATDLCNDALQHARAGRFRAKRLEQIPEALRRRFFVEEKRVEEKCAEEKRVEEKEHSGQHEQFYCALPSLKQRMCFAQTNLLDAANLPTLLMDVIFCQNVLVYFRRWRVKQVLDALVERLKPGGLLILGPGEGAHWHHPELVRTAHQGVTAWLRRVESSVSDSKPSDSKITQTNLLNTIESAHKTGSIHIQTR